MTVKMPSAPNICQVHNHESLRFTEAWTLQNPSVWSLGITPGNKIPLSSRNPSLVVIDLLKLEAEASNATKDCGIGCVELEVQNLNLSWPQKARAVPQHLKSMTWYPYTLPHSQHPKESSKPSLTPYCSLLIPDATYMLQLLFLFLLVAILPKIRTFETESSGSLML